MATASNVDPLTLQCNSSSSSSSTQTSTTTVVDEIQQDQTNIKLLEDADSVNWSALKIEIPPSTGDFKVIRHSEDDPKTPTSTENRIPVMAACPLAPKKTRWVPATRKRKVPPPFVPVVRVPAAADYIIYVDAMFALNEAAVYIPDIMVGDLGAGDRTKRVKLLPSPPYEA